MFSRLLVLAALSFGACASSNTTFTVEYPRDKPAIDHTKISVLGVFKDGRINESNWDDVGTALASVLGSSTCELGFAERLKLEEPEVFAKADSESKESGVTDDLLKPFAARARGTAILAMTISGRLHAGPSFRAETMEKTTGKSTKRGKSAKAREETGLEITLALFSVEAKQTAVSLHLRYTGGSTEEAFQLFADKLRRLVPGAHCEGWRWK